MSAIGAEIARRLARDLDAALVATLDVASASALIDAMCAPAFVRPAWPRDR